MKSIAFKYSGVHSSEDIANSFIPTRLILYRTMHKKMKFSVQDFFSKCDKIYRKLQIWSQLLKNSLMENFIFCVI